MIVSAFATVFSRPDTFFVFRLCLPLLCTLTCSSASFDSFSYALSQAAIEAALAAKEKWARLDYESRAAITLKLAGKRRRCKNFCFDFWPFSFSCSLCFSSFRFCSLSTDLISGPLRANVLAATILGQSKNFFQAEVHDSSDPDGTSNTKKKEKKTASTHLEYTRAYTHTLPSPLALLSLPISLSFACTF